MMALTARDKSEYSVKLVIRLMLVFLTAILALKISGFAIYVVGTMLLLTFAQKRIEYSLYMLIMLAALSIVNGGLVPKGFNFNLITRGSFFALAIMMSVKAGFQKSAWLMSPFWFLFVYIFYMMVTSLGGWWPLVSELKAVLFLVFLTALTQTVSAVTQEGVDIRKIRAAMLVVAIFYVLGSVAVIPFPSIGNSMTISFMSGYGQDAYATDMSGLFNGVTWHSQELGTIMAILNAYLLSDYLCNFQRKNRLYQLLLACIPILIYKSSSRTALFTYFLSIGVTVFFFHREKHVTQGKKSRVMTNMFLLGLIAAFVIVLTPGVGNRFEAFLRKSKDVESIDKSRSITEDVTFSRMGLIEKGLVNFRKSPVIGNGFQVSEEMQELSKEKTGLILTAPIEKGVLPVMVLEEGGVVGAIIFLAFLIAVYVRCSNLRLTCFLSTFTVFIILNFGEASFFSSTGGGGLMWTICFIAILMDMDRYRLTKNPVARIQKYSAYGAGSYCR